MEAREAIIRVEVEAIVREQQMRKAPVSAYIPAHLTSMEPAPLLNKGNLRISQTERTIYLISRPGNVVLEVISIESGA